jgi:hypothetical protein
MTTSFFVLQMCGWLVGIPLEFLVVAALIRGPYRQFPLVFLYASANFVAALVEIPFRVQYFLTGQASVWDRAAKIYWVNDVILQVLVFAVVISLIDQAASEGRRRRMVRAGLIAGALLFAGASLFIHYHYVIHHVPPPLKSGYWSNPWMRDLNVCTTVLDLALWTMLIASRQGDRRLLLISGALGMQFTGEAIGAAIRDLSVPKMVEAISLTGSVVSVLADAACLYVLWQTFRSARDCVPSLTTSNAAIEKES